MKKRSNFKPSGALCGKMVHLGLMTEPRACPLAVNHKGGHCPDLTGMWFHQLRVVCVGNPRRGNKSWNCVDAKGRNHFNVLTKDILSGASRGVAAPKGTGCVTPAGYRVIKHEGKQALEHRVVMAKILGRPLQPNETVHHGPKGRACNDPENLSIRLKGNHPTGHGVAELADWLRSLGCIVQVPAHLLGPCPAQQSEPAAQQTYPDL